MDYAGIFLERADQLKYQLYSLLARPYVTNMTITDLAGLMQAKYQPTYNVFQELLGDLVAITGKRRDVVRKQMLVAAPLPLSLDAYRSYLVQQSLVYRLIDYAVTAAAPSPNQFCEREFISRSTISRKLKPVNNLMAHFGVKLKLAKLAFSGSEMNIRYFLYTVYWWAHRGSFWPFENVTRSTLHEECNQIGIMNERPMTQWQMQYFLAISHLRVGKNHAIVDNPYLDALDQKVVTLHLRAGQPRPPFTRTDTAFYNFFQISQPRFDMRSRLPEAPAQEIAVLTNPASATVVDALCNALYQSASGDIGTDLYLNMLRLVFGYLICGGDFPQAQDVIGGGVDESAPNVVEKVQAVVQTLPTDAAFDVFRQNCDPFAIEIARLATPYVRRCTRNARVFVKLDVDPAIEGYQALTGFLNCVPWVARVSEVQSDEECDVVIGADDSPAKNLPADFTWYANALDLATYRESLIQKLVTIRKEKQALAALE
ncbi:helix-turn-helix domain-containing protein [Lacticaseibacillus baoqingensis]|uniref:Helix-turn-helix domain-containing protein n=1 Tax=Lacticaseibacillus baoqingensis TaxID=2486013 RepID=A0ABW4EBC4_9LACO|nr:helix-turn-helix domain-containing protein [Lacticaseibacillus baoqingensis]